MYNAGQGRIPFKVSGGVPSPPEQPQREWKTRRVKHKKMYARLFCYFSVFLDSLRGSSVKIGTIQRRLAWPLRKDDTHKSRSVNKCNTILHHIIILYPISPEEGCIYYIIAYYTILYSIVSYYIITLYIYIYTYIIISYIYIYIYILGQGSFRRASSLPPVGARRAVEPPSEGYYNYYYHCYYYCYYYIIYNNNNI